VTYDPYIVGSNPTTGTGRKKMGKITYFIGQRWWHSVTHDPKIVGSNPKGGTGREKIAKNTLVSCQRG
jgi:hypothetical protein